MMDIILSLKMIMNGFESMLVCMLYPLDIIIRVDHLFVVEWEDMQKDENIYAYEEAEFGLLSIGSGT